MRFVLALDYKQEQQNKHEQQPKQEQGLLKRIWSIVYNKNTNKTKTKTKNKRYIKALSNIYDSNEDKVYGYIIGVYGLAEWDTLQFQTRLDILKSMLRFLKEHNVDFLIVSEYGYLLSTEEEKMIEASGTHMTSSLLLNQVLTIQCFKKAVRIMGSKTKGMKAAVWNIDSCIGEIWCRLLAEAVDDIVIGSNYKFRARLILREFMKNLGLSPIISDNVDNCLVNKDIIVFTENACINANISPLILLLTGRSNYNTNRSCKPKIIIKSGAVNLPNEIKINCDLSNYQKNDLLHGLIYLLSPRYRNICARKVINNESIKCIIDILDTYSIDYVGFIGEGTLITYNNFRKIIFT